MNDSSRPLVLHQKIKHSLTDRADVRCLDLIGVENALKLQCLPLQSAGAVRPVAYAEHLGRRAVADLRLALEPTFGPVALTPVPKQAIQRTVERLRGRILSNRALRRTKAEDSCRDWSGPQLGMTLLTASLFVLLVGVVSPVSVIWALTIWVTLTLALTTLLRTTAAVVSLRHARRAGQTWSSRRACRIDKSDLPRISILIPLFDEPNIVSRLIPRLNALEYPRNKLEFLIVTEFSDTVTREALQATNLPEEFRVVVVPPGSPQTKPRALNYALDFASGSIIGVYDAEDAPAPDQLLRVAESFEKYGPGVACLQGILDFYNTRQSWLTRCFAVDYATWFRLILPGIARLGLVVPLGGTTVFLRRAPLEAMGRWDAHNVTEDADLGIRLARRGYRTEFIPSVTEEEATATVGAWVRQRSRWIKGYAITWAVHMRDPLKLLGDLGLLRFIGVQIVFLGTLTQFALAPLLWSFWLVLFGIPHPFVDAVSWNVMLAVASVFFFSELATMAVSAIAVSTPKHRHLIWWVLMLHFYFPLAAFAAWKGYFELISRPFFWDKTAHGRTSNPPVPRPA